MTRCAEEDDDMYFFKMSTKDTPRSLEWLILVLLGAMVATGVSSCAFRRLKSDIRRAEKQVSLNVTVDMDDDIEGQLVGVIYTPYNKGQRVAAFKKFDPKIKRMLFVIEQGDYRAALFHDRNKNLVIDSDEAVELLNDGRRLPFSEVTKRIDLDVHVPEGHALPEGYPRNLAELPDSLEGDYHFAVGDVADLNDPRFSKATGRMGLWEPVRFLKENGVGIYMVKPFTKDRIPVLFVNGAGGSPQNWRFFFDRLDKTKYQAWFYLYPSGVRIARLGQTLNSLMRALAEKYEVAQIHMVAHSMGGLVAREALVCELREDAPLLVHKFVTISTPWNGHAMAQKGVDAFFTPIPSWHDVVPGSPFLQTVFDTRLSPKIDHHLLFGYLTGSEEDGSVALSSVLLQEAQDDAVEVRGFEGDHVAVLFSENVIDYVHDILSNPNHLQRRATCPSESRAAEIISTDDAEAAPPGDTDTP